METNFSHKTTSIFLNTLYTVLINTNQWQRLSWKNAYAMILANNTNWISSQPFVCGRAKFEPLGRRHLCHLFIAELLKVWPVGYMDLHITDWVTKTSQVPYNLNWQPTNLSSSYTFQFSAYILSLNYQEYNYSSWDFICLEVPKKAKWLRRSMLNIYLK